MAKAPVIKFPRISAGFYSITMDGEFVGYVMKEVDSDSKETNWYIFDDNEPHKDIAMLNPSDSIDTPDALLREAKESAKNYFLNKPLQVEDVPQAIQLNEEDWDEDEDLLVEDEDLLDEDELMALSDEDDLDFEAEEVEEERELALV